VDFPSYGYVWLPNAGPDFYPYSSRGSWIMTDYGWTWLSDYIWGWAPMCPGMSVGMSSGNNYYNYSNQWIFVKDKYFGRNNERVLQQQNVEKLDNGRREQSVNTVNSSINTRSEESRKRFF